MQKKKKLNDWIYLMVSFLEWKVKHKYPAVDGWPFQHQEGVYYNV